MDQKDNKGASGLADKYLNRLSPGEVVKFRFPSIAFWSCIGFNAETIAEMLRESGFELSGKTIEREYRKLCGAEEFIAELEIARLEAQRYRAESNALVMRTWRSEHEECSPSETGVIGKKQNESVGTDKVYSVQEPSNGQILTSVGSSSAQASPTISEGKVRPSPKKYWFPDEELEPIVLKIRDAFKEKPSTRITLPEENYSIKLTWEVGQALQVNRYRTLEEVEHECYKE